MSDVDNNAKAQAWEAAESTFAAHAARRHIPLRGTFELTPRCNFNCKMCYIHMTPKEMASVGGGELSTKQWLYLAEEAIKSGTLNLLLTGGEPLLRDDFEELYTQISKMGFIVSINTNASLMNEKYYKLFSKYPPFAVAATLYGADEATYQSICGNGADFTKTLKGLAYLADLPSTLEVRTTFIKDNMDQLDRLREIANRYTKIYAINYMVFKAIPGVSTIADQCRLSGKECMALIRSNEEYYEKLNEDKEEPVEEAKDVSHDGMEKNDPKLRDYGIDVFPEVLTCMASKCMYWIRWDGKMLPCGTFASPYTLPLEEGFQQAWDRLPELLRDLKHPQKCVECENYHNCPNCPAYFQMETGSFDVVADYVCELAKERSVARRA